MCSHSMHFVIVMLGLHIATMRYECQKSPFVMEDHEFDLNLMVRTRGFTHCHELLRLMARIAGESSRIITYSHEYCPALLRFTERHCEFLRPIVFYHECHETCEFGIYIDTHIYIYLYQDVENCSAMKDVVCI